MQIFGLTDVKTVIYTLVSLSFAIPTLIAPLKYTYNPHENVSAQQIWRQALECLTFL